MALPETALQLFNEKRKRRGKNTVFNPQEFENTNQVEADTKQDERKLTQAEKNAQTVSKVVEALDAVEKGEAIAGAAMNGVSLPENFSWANNKLGTAASILHSAALAYSAHQNKKQAQKARDQMRDEYNAERQAMEERAGLLDLSQANTPHGV